MKKYECSEKVLEALEHLLPNVWTCLPHARALTILEDFVERCKHGQKEEFGPDYLGDNANWCKWNYELDANKREWAFCIRQAEIYKTRIAEYLDGRIKEWKRCQRSEWKTTTMNEIKEIRKALCGDK